MTVAARMQLTTSQKIVATIIRFFQLYPGVVSSSMLHLMLLFLIVFHLPFHTPKKVEIIPINLEMLPVKEKAARKKEPMVKPQPQIAKPKPRVKPKAPPMPPKPTAKKPKPKAKPAPMEKPELKEVLKTLDKPKEPEKPQLTEAEIRELLATTVVQNIRAQVAACWNVLAGANEAQNMAVELRLDLAMDGVVDKVELVDTARYKRPGQQVFVAAADSAMRAVKACSPFKNLPTDTYQHWRQMDLVFDPSQLIY